MSTMIQNPNEIEAFTRRQRALARIHRNITEKFQLNRRQFISGSLATMALAALGLSGCAPKTPAASTGDAAPAFTPGTYEATAQGRNGEIKVSVTFEADRVASIEADHMESRNIGDAAVRLLTDNYLETQKLSVDTVTGATLTSMAFATAVAECAEAAGADMRAIMKGDASVNAAEPISDEADVVVIGSGGAALAAAVTAAEAGKSVVMLEKMDIYGGNTNAGEGTLNAPDPERQEPMGIEDSPDFYYTQTFEGGDSAGDPALVRILADNALDAVHWMEDHGLVYEKEVFTAIGGLWQRGHAVEVERKGEQGGSYYVSCLMDAAQATGNFTLYTDAKIEELIVEGGAVVGVRGTRPSSGEAVEVRGKSVVLATGGYSRNAELAMQYDKRVTESMPSSNVCSSTGDGLALAEAAGAGLRNMELVQIHPLGDPQNGGVATFVGLRDGQRRCRPLHPRGRAPRHHRRCHPGAAERRDVASGGFHEHQGRPLGGDRRPGGEGPQLQGRHHRGLGDPDRRGSLDARRDHRGLQRLRGRRQGHADRARQGTFGRRGVRSLLLRLQAHPDHPLHHGRRVH